MSNPLLPPEKASIPLAATTPQGPPGIRHDLQPVVRARDVQHAFGTGDVRKQVLFDIDLDIMPGEIVIVTGPSGSGKITLLTLIGALRSVQDGSLQVAGQRACRHTPQTVGGHATQPWVYLSVPQFV
jgi:ABC-type bacteriocin/lantibiotic exporter with double-glycine peptidase domain